MRLHYKTHFFLALIVGFFLIGVGNKLFTLLKNTPRTVKHQDKKVIAQSVLAAHTSSLSAFPAPVSLQTPSPILTSTLTPTPKPTQTPTPTPPPSLVAPQMIDKYFEDYSQKYHVDIQLLRKVAVCESGYNSNSRNGDYAGMFQFSSRTWISTRQNMGENIDPNLRFNPQEAIKTAAFKISAGGAGSWPNCQ